MRSVLITGGSGFLGQHLARRLFDERAIGFAGADGHEWDRICIYSRSEHVQAAMRHAFGEDANPRMRWFIGDVRDQERLERAMQGIDLVLHCAALKRIELGYYAPDEMIKTNVLGTMNVIEAAARARVSKVLLVSSDKAYQPVSPYGQSKALAESLVLAANNVHPHGPRYAVVRYGNVWASAGSVVPTWTRMLDAGEPLRLTDPNCTRFFMTIDEACDLVLNTAESMQGGELAIPDLSAYRVGDLAQAFTENCGHDIAWRITGLPAWEKLHESMDHERSSARAPRMSVKELRRALCG